MRCVLRVPEFNTVYALKELPDDSLDGEVVEGGWVEIPDEVFDWPAEMVNPPSPTLGVCQGDPRHYRLFKLPEDVEQAGFQPVGMIYGGGYTPPMWERFLAGIPSMRSFYAIPNNDPPEAMEKAMQYIREARRLWPGS